jgi:homopolymeric O-antigen transport system ATP-binding protein
MSNRTVISVENVSKVYRLNHKAERERYLALRDVLAYKLRGLFHPQSWRTNTSCSKEDFWALKNVSFEVKQGDVVGIIGRNGAGKSTLLKILSRITEPSEGCLRIKGRVASLLEVGTGFHPELTGRENVFLNGAILGMTRAEIKRRFDEIVAFAEVEKFLDTPVKHYSSGMYVRLAFAVAAHLEPEILVVDEVLAVGDASFQKKCLGKIGDAASGGRTVLFVSHNMAAIQRLCNRAVVLEGGKAVSRGSIPECIKIYRQTGTATAGGKVDLSLRSGTRRRGSGTARFESAELLDLEGRRISAISFAQAVRFRFSVRVLHRTVNTILGFSFITRDGIELQGTAAHDGGLPESLEEGLHFVECTVNPMLLVPGAYFLRAAIFSRTEEYEYLDEFLPFEVVPFADGRDGCLPPAHLVGHIYQPYEWSRAGIAATSVEAYDSTPEPARQH